MPSEHQAIMEKLDPWREAQNSATARIAGAAVNDVESLDETALHVAAEDDYVEIAPLAAEGWRRPDRKAYLRRDTA